MPNSPCLCSVLVLFCVWSESGEFERVSWSFQSFVFFWDLGSMEEGEGEWKFLPALDPEEKE